ncbi:hypothetical protein [Methylomonas sp. AM2-LC]|uniref:hypothetical protein n=1 Tax=Methylomonas sp. AM2-LC TaxID=3153301 RepID=UPI0032646CCF
MKTIENYLDELKEQTGSDNKSASALGMDRSAVSNMRKRGLIADETAVKIAELLKIDPLEVLIAAAVARSGGEVKTVWMNAAKRAGIAAGMAIVILNNGIYNIEAQGVNLYTDNLPMYTLCEVKKEDQENAAYLML